MSLSDTLKAVSDSHRREILEMLLDGPRPAGDLASAFELSAATVSHHLSILKKAQLVKVTREGTFLYYELEPSALEDVALWLKVMGKGGKA